MAALILSGNTLYGTASMGGNAGSGTMFAVNTDGSGFTTLHDFAFFNIFGGAEPQAALILSGSTLYGTTISGGNEQGDDLGFDGTGTVFRLSLPVNAPQLTINLSGNNLIVSWPLSVTGFLLQTNGNLCATNWCDYGGAIINNSVTNSLSTGNLFFRLEQQ